MEDKLKKWLQEQNASPDIYSPDLEKGWEVIKAKRTLKDQKKNRKSFYMKIAATLLLLLCGSAIFFYGVTVGEQQATGGYALNRELQETQVFYTSIIDQKMKVAKTLTSDRQIFIELEEMDQAFAELKDALADQADNEEVVQAMISNYKLKLKILDRILEQLEDKQVKE